MFLSEPFLFAVQIIDSGAIIFLQIYYLIVLSDLELDYINARECCAKLNFWITPKLMAHTIGFTLLLLHGHWLLAVVHLPLAVWLVNELFKIPKGNLGIFDPAEIYNRGQIKKHMRESMVYFVYYLTFFFVYLYCMIAALIEGDPINRHEDEMIMQ